jgi:hypothetical protein
LIVAPHSTDIDETLDRAVAAYDMPRTLVSRFDLHETWSRPERHTPLTAVYLIESDAVHAFVTDRALDTPGPAHFHATAKRCRAAVFSLQEPLRLAPVSVDKPWGREIWYTGIEARGTSGVTDGRYTTPLSWVLASAPRHLRGDAPVALVKVLDPSPEPVLGDLYFELHETKQEVYVVTHVDRRAWPDGLGAIRFGMNAARRAVYADDAKFRAAFLKTVREYEGIRRTIDDLLDAKRIAAGIALDVPVPLVLMQRWLDELDPLLIEDERVRRDVMNSFTQMRPLSEGDIVQLPCRFPHALQHGVRVIELQTPTYERHILSFAQKVLTQDHWDSEAAIAEMRLDIPPPEEPRVLVQEPDCTIERVVEFDAFSVRRVRLAPGVRLTLSKTPPHTLCIAVSGEVTLGNATLADQSACLVPQSATRRTLLNTGARDAVCLLSGQGL